MESDTSGEDLDIGIEECVNAKKVKETALRIIHDESPTKNYTATI